MQKRPTAAIMGDDWFGHRDPLTGDPVGDKEEYLSWDWALLNAFQTIEDYTDPESGLPAWEVEGEGVEVDAIRKVNKFLAAKENATRGSEKFPYKPRPGEKWYPEMCPVKRTRTEMRYSPRSGNGSSRLLIRTKTDRMVRDLL